VDSQAFAQMTKAFVISACGTVDERMIAMLEPGAEAERFLRSPDCCGGSVIVAPNSRIIAGPMGAEEGILYADCNLELAIQMKLRHDFAGHYNRPDIFHLQINRAAPTLYSVHGGEHALPHASAAKLAAEPSALLASPSASTPGGAPSRETPDDDAGNRDE
jgi:aliphatic nitrilase